jgi:hypothetical protein
MPCRDGREEEHRTVYREDTTKIKAMSKKLLDFEANLCSACRSLERLGYDFDENPTLSEWWEAHKEADEKRQNEEAMKKATLKLAIEIAETKSISELTLEDRELLTKVGIL